MHDVSTHLLEFLVSALHHLWLSLNTFFTYRAYIGFLRLNICLIMAQNRLDYKQVSTTLLEVLEKNVNEEAQVGAPIRKNLIKSKEVA